jgi:class 3 adenylate cyclase/DNA-binding NarL/FixJ family response regulator
MIGRPITVVLADDNLIVREGVRALISLEDDIEIVGVASDYDELIAGAEAARPQVVVTDIRMPPSFQTEGIDAAKEVRGRYPGTGVVILSQYDDPEYAISLLGDGAAGYGYLLKDGVAEGDQLVRAIREVSAGGSVIDPKIVRALVEPVTRGDELSPDQETLLEQIAAGKPIKAIAAARSAAPAAVSEEVDALFLKLAQGASHGELGALRRLKMLHEAIVDREEQGETLSRMLPGGLAEKVRKEGHVIGATETLEVTVLMSDIRGYSMIAEASDPSVLAGQLSEHRAEMSRCILEEGGTVMQFVGDAVMGVFGAPIPDDDHAQKAVEAATAMHAAQSHVNEQWVDSGVPPFHLGIGLSTGRVAAALLGSEQRLEYSVVGDSVNLAQRLQQLAEGGQTVLSRATYEATPQPPPVEELPPQKVKGRRAEVHAFLMKETR